MLTKEDLQAIQEMIKDSQRQTVAFVESYMDPKIQLLAENQTTIMEMITPKSRIDNLEEEIEELRFIVRAMRQQIKELQKAQ